MAGRREAEVVGIEAVAEVPREVGGVVVEVSHQVESFYTLLVVSGRY